MLLMKVLSLPNATDMLQGLEILYQPLISVGRCLLRDQFVDFSRILLTANDLDANSSVFEQLMSEFRMFVTNEKHLSWLLSFLILLLSL